MQLMFSEKQQFCRITSRGGEWMNSVRVCACARARVCVRESEQRGELDYKHTRAQTHTLTVEASNRIAELQRLDMQMKL